MVRRSALSGASQLAALAARMAASGANLTVETPDGDAIAIGEDPTRARVVFHSAGAVGALLRGRHLALAEAYLRQELDVEGDLRQALFVTDHLDLGRAWRSTGGA
jgi:hypothetical protein